MNKYLLLLFFILSIKTQLLGQQFGQFVYQNRLRTYWMYLPKNYSVNEKLPLVIQMHGFTLDGKFHMQYTEYNKIADTARCIVVYPNGIDKRWNSGTFFFVQSNVDDVGFLSELIDRMHLKYNIDLEKVYAGGYSAGGFMSYKLACDLTNRIAAISPVVASMVFDNVNSCVPLRAISVMACNGADDPVTAYNGIPLNFPSIDTVKKIWQQKNSCDGVPTIDTLPNTSTTDNSRAVSYTYNNCTDNVTTQFYKILNGGHTWPGAPNYFFGVIGNTNNDIQWSSVSWNFFKQNSIPTSVLCDAPQNLQAVSNTAISFDLSWDAVSNVNGYKIALLDSAQNTIKTFMTSSNTMSITIDSATLKYNWSVAANCSSGYRNWATPKPLNYLLLSNIKRNNVQSIAVYPNPATDILKFTLPKQNQHIDIFIYDMNGNLVYTQPTKNAETNVLITDLPKGVYVLNCITKDILYQSKFIKQ